MYTSLRSVHLFFTQFTLLQQQRQQQPFYGPLSGTTRVSWYQKKHSPTHHPNHHLIFISFFHLPRSIALSLFKLRAWQSFCTTSLHVLFGLPLGLEPSTSHSIHFVTQSVNQCLVFAAHAHTIATCFAVVSILYHQFLVFVSTPYLEILSFALALHIHLTILISARWSATSFSFMTVLPCTQPKKILCFTMLFNQPCTTKSVPSCDSIYTPMLYVFPGPTQLSIPNCI